MSNMTFKCLESLKRMDKRSMRKYSRPPKKPLQSQFYLKWKNLWILPRLSQRQKSNNLKKLFNLRKNLRLKNKRTKRSWIAINKRLANSILCKFNLKLNSTQIINWLTRSSKLRKPKLWLRLGQKWLKLLNRLLLLKLKLKQPQNSKQKLKKNNSMRSKSDKSYWQKLIKWLRLILKLKLRLRKQLKWQLKFRRRPLKAIKISLNEKLKNGCLRKNNWKKKSLQQKKLKRRQTKQSKKNKLRKLL